MSHAVTAHPVPSPRIVDLSTITPGDLEGLWRYEEQWWREQLLWDISDALAALRRVVERCGVAGKAVCVGTRTVGYAYYVIAGHVGILSGLVVSPEWNQATVGEPLLQATVDAVRQQGVTRIECPCVCMPHTWLVPGFERAGFQTYWREFLRLDLHGQALPPPPRL